MKLPLGAWKDTLTSLGFSRRNKRSKSKGRSVRRMQLESLEPRQMLTTQLYWDGGSSGTWNTTNVNWSPNPGGGNDVAWSSSAQAVFNRTASTVTVASGITADSIAFQTTGYTLSGGSISLTNAGTIDVAPGLSDTISSALNGSNGLTKVSLGKLVLSSTSNSYTGGTSILAGTLSVSADTNLGNSSGSVNINGGTLLASAGFTLGSSRSVTVGPSSGSGGGTIDVASGQTLTYAGVIANNGSGTGNLTLVDTGTLSLSGASTYSGSTTLINGTLSLTGSSNRLSTSGTLNLAGGALTLASGISQTFATTNVNAGYSVLTVGTSGTLTMGTMNRSAGGGVLGLSSSGGSFVGTTTNTNGIIPWAVFPGSGTTEYAATSNSGGSGTIAKYTGSYTTLTTGAISASTTNYKYVSNTNITVGNDVTQTVNALKVAGTGGAAGPTVQLGSSGHDSTLALTSGGLIVDASLGPITFANSVGKISPTTGEAIFAAVEDGNGDLIFDPHIESGNSLTIANKSTGSGRLFLGFNSAWTYTGATTISGNNVLINAANVIPTGSVLVVNWPGSFDVSGYAFNTLGGLSGNGVILNSGFNTSADEQLTLNLASNQTFSGSIQDAAKKIGITIDGDGSSVQTFTDTNTFTGGLTVFSGGILAVPFINNSGTSGPLGANTTVRLGGATTNGTLEVTDGSQTSNMPFTLGGNSSGTGGAGIFQIDTSTTNVTLSGAITDVSGQNGNLIKTGAGTLILIGADTYSGPTSVNAGTLVLGSGGSLDGTAISVANLATFAANPGSGTVSSGSTGSGTSGSTLTLNSGSTFAMTDGATGTYNLQQQTSFAGTGLTISGATLNFDLSSSAADKLAVSKGASVSGTNIINITALGSSLSTGNTYNLITAASGLSGTYHFSDGLTTEVLTVGGHNYALSLSSSATAVSVTVSATTDYWVDGTSGTWDTTTMNWSTTSGGTANIVYHDGDNVVFDNNAASFNVTIGVAVAPGSVTFSNTTAHAYTVTGSGSNVMTGTGTIGISGGGTVTLVGANTISGATTISSGTLQLGNGTTNGSVGDGITDNGSLIFANAAAQTYSSVISGTGSVTKNSAGALTLTGANTYSGSTTVSAGSFVLGSGGSLDGSAISVASGATFAADPGAGTVSAGSTGSGTSGSSLTLNSGSTYAMTDSATGTFNLQQQTSYASSALSINGASLNFDLSSSGADKLAVTKGASVSGTNTVNITALGSSLSTGNTYNLITAASGLTGTFKFSNGLTTEVLVVGGHNYTLTLNNSATVLSVTVSPTVDYWVDGTSGVWDTTTMNWSTTSGGTANIVYHDGDAVVFDNNAASFNVTIGTAVSPSSVTFSNTTVHAYTVTGSGSNILNGTGTITVSGGGSVTLVGPHTISGTTTISSGTLQLGNGTTNGSVGDGITDNGTLIFANASAQTYSGVIGGSGNVQLNGDGVTFSGANTYSGTTTVSSGATLKAGATNAFSANSAYTVSGTLDLAGFSQSIGSLAGSSTSAIVKDSSSTAATLTAGANNSSTTFAGVIQNGTGTLSLTKAGTGTLILTGTNTATGTTTISAGVLQLGDGTTNGTVGDGITDNASLVFNNGSAQTYSGIITGSGTVTKNGGGTLTLIASSTFSGTTTISAGKLQLGDSSHTGAVGDGIVDNATVEFANPTAQTYSGVISGTGNFIKSGAGVLTVTAVSTYSGSTTVSGGTLKLGAAITSVSIANSGFESPSTSTYVGLVPDSWTNATIGGSFASSGVAVVGQPTGAPWYTASPPAGSQAAFIQGGGGFQQSLSFASTANYTLVFHSIGRAWSGGETLNVYLDSTLIDSFTPASTSSWETDTVNLGSVSSGSHTLKFVGGQNTLDRSDDIDAITITTSAGALPTATALTVSSGATLDMNGNSQQVGSLSGAGTVTDSAASTLSILTSANSSGSTTFSGVIQDGSGRTGLTKSGAGTEVLTNANTYTGGTIVAGGTLQLGNGSTNGSVTGNITDNATLTFANGSSQTFAGVISGSGTLNKSGSGTLILANTNTATGVTTISAGTLQLGDGSSNNGSVADGIVNNSILAFANPSAQTYAGQITGSGAITKNAGGTLTLTGSSTNTGVMTINAGRVNVNGRVSNSITINGNVPPIGNGGAGGGGGALGGSGVTGAVTNDGGTYDALAYVVTIPPGTPINPSPDSESAVHGSAAFPLVGGTLSYNSGTSNIVFALSAADAAFRVVGGSITVSDTDSSPFNITYHTDETQNAMVSGGGSLPQPAFIYNPSFSVGSFTGSALVLEDRAAVSSPDYDYNDDYFPVNVQQVLLGSTCLPCQLAALSASGGANGSSGATAGGITPGGSMAVSPSGSDQMDSGTFGLSFDPSTILTNIVAALTGSNGGNATAAEQPRIIKPDANTILAIDGTIAVWFDKIGGTWYERFGGTDTLIESGSQYVLEESSGMKIRYTNFDSPLLMAQRGQWIDTTAVDGSKVTQASTNSAGQPVDIQVTNASSTPLVSYHYNYVASGADAGLVSDVTLKRWNGTTFVPARQTVYSYYNGGSGAGMAYGNVGDLMLSQVMDADGNVLDTTYYRYYTSDSSVGYKHGLEYILSNDSYTRLLAATSASLSSPDNALNASDTTVGYYADDFYQYDSLHRVKQLVSQGTGCSVCSNGQGTYTYEYDANPNAAPNDYNNWASKTIETLPDNTSGNTSRNIYYTNFIGETILAVEQHGTQQWITYHHYDNEGREILMAHPSAVNGYDDSYADLLNYHYDSILGGYKYQYLNDHAGLIDITDYYSSTDTVPDYVKDHQVQQGQLGTKVLEDTTTYTSHTDSNGVTIHPVATTTSYRNTGGTGGETTTYTYTFYSGTNQIQQEDITLPVVGTSQHGTGSSDVSSTYNDSFGRPVWTRDAAGFISYTAYDSQTGAVVEQIQDVRSAQATALGGLPSGWSISGTHLGLKTTMQVDSLGRTIETTDPNGHATFTIYDDADHEVRTYTGWIDNGDGTFSPQSGVLPPTQVTIDNLSITTTQSADGKAGTYSETFTMSATPDVDSNGRPTGGEAIDDVQSLSISIANEAGQVIETDDYYSLPDLSGDVSSTATGSILSAFHVGTKWINGMDPSDANYYATIYQYDDLGNQDRVLNPNGTIHRTVYDGLSRQVSTWFGTIDAPGTSDDEWSPTNQASGDDMVLLTATTYDEGAVGDSNVSGQLSFPNGVGTVGIHDTAMFYDWRDRLVATKQGILLDIHGDEAYTDESSDGTNRPLTVETLDNLGQTVEERVYNGNGIRIDTSSGEVAYHLGTSEDFYNMAGLLRAFSETSYDDQGRAFQTLVHSVKQDSGAIDGSDEDPMLSDPYNKTPEETDTFYDPRGLVDHTTDALGRTTSYAYDGVGRQTKVIQQDPITDGSDGNVNSADYSKVVTRTEYDRAGNVVSVIDPMGNVTSYVYDAADRQTRMFLPNPADGSGPTFTNDDDEDDALLTTNPETRYSYDAAGRLASVTDPLSHITSYSYDALGRTHTVTAPDPDGSGPLSSPVTTTTYDGDGNVITMTDPNGNVTSFEYDLLDHQTQVIQPIPGTSGAHPTTVNAYDNLGELLTTTDPLSRTTSYAYNGLGQRITVTSPDPDGIGPLTSPVAQASYDTLSNLSSTTDALDNVTTNVYDGFGRLSEVIQPSPDGIAAQPTTTYGYDADGERTSQTDPMGRTTGYAYDSLGRRISVTQPDPDGSGSLTQPVTSYAYDADSNLVSVTDPLGNKTTYAYDHLNRRTSVTQADPDGTGPLSSPVTLYGYDFDNNLTSVTDPDLNVTSYDYDNLNRQTSMTDQLTHTAHYTYDDNSNLIRTVDRNSQEIDYEYDHLNRRITESWISGYALAREIDTAYNDDGQVVSVTDSGDLNGQYVDYAYTYDGIGRLLTVTSTRPVDPMDTDAGTVQVVLTAGYDSNGNRTSLDATINGTTDDFQNTYSFDALNRMIEEAQAESSASGSNTVADKRVDFSYKSDGQFDTITRYNDVAGTQPVATSTYSYDGIGRLKSLTHAQGLTTFADYSWTYDADSWVRTFSNNANYADYSAENATYSYDNNGQLTGADRSGTANDESYGFDDNGNRNNDGFTPGSNNRLSTDGTWDYYYDDNGNLTSQVSITTEGPDVGITIEYGYDFRNRLVSVTTLDSLDRTTQDVEYSYDSWNNLVGRSMTTNTYSGLMMVATSTTADHYTYDGGNLVLVTDDAGDVAGRAIFGPAVDQILAQEDSMNTVTWSLTDNQNTVRDLVQYVGGTDPTAVVDHRTYTAFGKPISTPAVDFLFGYTGRFSDHATGLQWNNARWYNSSIQRWMSEDPIFPQSGSNPYDYVGNDPANVTDPSGLADAGTTDPYAPPLPPNYPASPEIHWVFVGDMWWEFQGSDQETPIDTTQSFDWAGFLGKATVVVEGPSAFIAGGGDSFTFGLSKIGRELIWGKEQAKVYYKNVYTVGEWTEIGVEIAVTGGSALLKKAAQKRILAEAARIAANKTGGRVTRAAIEAAIPAAKKALTNSLRSEARQIVSATRNELVHHGLPLLGHPAVAGGRKAVQSAFPTLGVEWLANSKLNLIKLLKNQPGVHVALHERALAAEQLAIFSSAPSFTAARVLFNLYRDFEIDVGIDAKCTKKK